MVDPQEELIRAKAVAANLAPGDLRGAEQLAGNLAGLPMLLSFTPADPQGAEWAVHELESLNGRYPDSLDIASAFAQSLHTLVEHDQDKAAVERKLRRLNTLAANYSANQKIAAGIAASLTNIALSEDVQRRFPPLSVQAAQRLEEIVEKHPHDSRIAGDLALLLQDKIRHTSDPAEKAAAISRIQQLALLHPGDQNISAVRNIVSQQQARGGCYVATAVYGSYDCPEVWVLRRFRDRSLAKNWLGRIGIGVYYSLSPVLVRLLGRRQWFATALRRPLDALVAQLQRAGFEQSPYSDLAPDAVIGK